MFFSNDTILYSTQQKQLFFSLSWLIYFTEEDAKKLQGKIQIKTSTVKAKKANKANMQEIQQGEKQSKPTKGKKASKAKIQDKKQEKN